MLDKRVPKIDLKFPKNFLWGVATSAHQIEGGNHNQWSVWELENAKSLAARAGYLYGKLKIWEQIKSQAQDPDNYVSGRAVDHYNRYKTDLAIAKKLNFNAFRFSVEWSRIEPEDGQFDPAAIAHYKNYVAEMKRLELEPILTLFHWTLPVWFAERGGFTKRSNIKFFVRFAEKIVSELGANIRYICILNEPESHVFAGFGGTPWPEQNHNKTKALWHYYNLAVAHNRAAKAIKRVNKRYKIGSAHLMANFYPGDKTKLSHWSAWVMHWSANYWFFNRIKRHLDWLGVNYYFSNRVIGSQVHNPESPLNDLGWYMAPGELEQVLEDTYEKYKLPIIVTENGLADQDDKYRQWWLKESILAMNNALKKGVDLRGYLHWSLLDNFEWSRSKWPRFGLVAVDYKTMRRKVRPSALWLAQVLKSLRANR